MGTENLDLEDVFVDNLRRVENMKKCKDTKFVGDKILQKMGPRPNF